jgi:hypothetical protein
MVIESKQSSVRLTDFLLYPDHSEVKTVMEKKWYFSYCTTALIWALSTSVLRFGNHTHTIRRTVRLLWMSDKLISEVFTYTGQHNI